MLKLAEQISSAGWKLDNTYARLPENLLTKLKPTPVKDPRLILLNDDLLNSLGLFFNNKKECAESVFSGNLIPDGSEYIAQAYAGHQFGYFTVLGDGRALLLGEQICKNGNRLDIQLKGSGQTPYSRGGDGRAALGPVLREYIISESMFALGVPTTRSLAVVSTGEKVFREIALPGAILTRVASSHLRVGTFQYAAASKNSRYLDVLINYAIKRHCPDVKNDKIPALGLLKYVVEKQLSLVVEWMRVGFVHGVMNTDNTSISGETIDYGPCAFVNSYSPETFFSSIDFGGRYSFGNQPSIAHWNMLRFAEALLPSIHQDKKTAIKIAEESLNDFSKKFDDMWLDMMRKKLGIINKKNDDKSLVDSLLSIMVSNKADYTNTFLSLVDSRFSNEKIHKNNSFISWKKNWEDRLKENNCSKEQSLILMDKNNPTKIPRNHVVEEALEAANVADFSLVKKLIDALSLPYKKEVSDHKYQSPPTQGDENYKTFCGT